MNTIELSNLGQTIRFFVDVVVALIGKKYVRKFQFRSEIFLIFNPNKAVKLYKLVSMNRFSVSVSLPAEDLEVMDFFSARGNVRVSNYEGRIIHEG